MDENVLVLQDDISNLLEIKKESDVIIIDDDEETQPSQPTPFTKKFSNNMKVDECHGKSKMQVNLGNIGGNPLSTDKYGSAIDIIEIDTDESDEDGETYYIRKILPHGKKSLFMPVKQYVTNKKLIRKAILAQSKQNTTYVDRYLDIETRNFNGEFKTPKKSYHDKLVYEALEEWKNASGSFSKGEPLLYICNICRRGWWRLHTFREHIKEHKEPNLNVTTQLIATTFILTAYTDNATLEINNIIIDSHCWRCDKSVQYHSISKRYFRYLCQGCLSIFPSCEKLSQHESVCKKHLEMTCEKLEINVFDLLECYVCFRKLRNQINLDIHMVQCHSVRTDQPAFIKVKLCKYCGGYFYEFKYHDCPKRYCIMHCQYCFRKFTNRTYLDMHMELYRGSCKCEICKKTMRPCVVLEHMVQHSKNYKLLYQCLKCKDNVLYDQFTYFNSHMQLHSQFANGRRWIAKVLLPVKCTNGEIVKSKTYLQIPRKDFKLFLKSSNTQRNEKDNISLDRNSSPETDEEVEIVASEEPIVQKVNMVKQFTTKENKHDIQIMINDNVFQHLNGTQNQGEPSEPEKMKNEYTGCDNYELQSELDAEIQRQVEMEAAISKVFCESKAYQKFLEKETVESDDGQYGDDYVDAQKNAEVTTISDSDSEDNVEMKIEDIIEFEESAVEEVDSNNAMKEVECDNMKEINAVSDGDKMTDETLKVGKRKRFEYEEELSNNEIINGDNTEANDTDISKINEETEMKAQNNIENDSENVTSRTEDVSEKSLNLYKCMECCYTGKLSTYMNHVTVKCCGLEYHCSRCSVHFPDLTRYVTHLTQHKYSNFTCPDCKNCFSDLLMLCADIKQHLRGLFVHVQSVANLPVVANITFVHKFKCVKCLKNVTLGQFFNHWESHLEANEEVEKVNQLKNCEIEKRKERLDADVVKDVLGVLFSTEKLLTCSICIICRRYFTTFLDRKRHLIQHLIHDAMLIKRISPDHCVQCHICNKNHYSIVQYRHHLREHTSLPLFKCKYCPKIFSEFPHCIKHMATHNKLKYDCELCGSKCQSKAILVHHLKTSHSYQQYSSIVKKLLSLDKPQRIDHKPCKHICRPCDIQFDGAKEMSQHLRSKHKIRRVMAVCPLCDKRFCRLIDVRFHLSNQHKLKRTEAVKFFNQSVRQKVLNQ